MNMRLRLKRLLSDPLAALSLGVITLIMTAGAFAPFFAPHDPYEVNMSLRYAGSSMEHWLGNDHLGRCILSRLIYGIRPSVIWVFGTLLLSALFGALLGLVSGILRGKTEAVIMGACDVVLSFPGTVMTLAIVGMLGVGMENILLAFILLKWAWFARVVRASVLQYTESEYVKFAKVIGVPTSKIMTKHIIPVTLPDFAVAASGSFGSMILQISGFSFLGLGIQAPHAEWGMMLNEVRDVLFTKPEFVIAPALAIIITVSSVQFLADALQKALNPQLSTNGAVPEASTATGNQRLAKGEVAG
ncbi:ABC transporter permease [Paenibacillus algicola]|uniref:ABC transporter permease n=2 Tax=Paenibacillus algicola TaxID=2565926 RepID=A0A4P8XJU3_9BACL|nr:MULTISPECIES: nickel/cobalt ABC transporter permease [Paenibacillus]QCT02932.1 ABC transporter permease [Paenibacillus algicola]